MARSTRKPSTAPTTLLSPGYADDTGPRIRAFLRSLAPAPLDVYKNDKTGRDLIELMSEVVDGVSMPTLRLSTEQIADVPRNPSTWWTDPGQHPATS